MIAEVCWPCVCGLHFECLAPKLIDDAGDVVEGLDFSGDRWLRCCCHDKPADTDAGAFAKGVGRPMLDPDQITDNLSTGRKRAAMLYPILDGMTCEWAGLKFAGGGIEPIIGCSGNKIVAAKGSSQTAHRHHGPDKNVVNNRPGNVHLICTFCHNRYHASNNRYYNEPRPEAGKEWLPDPKYGECKPHDPVTRATEEELEDNEKFWAVKADRREPSAEED